MASEWSLPRLDLAKGVVVEVVLCYLFLVFVDSLSLSTGAAFVDIRSLFAIISVCAQLLSGIFPFVFPFLQRAMADLMNLKGM